MAAALTLVAVGVFVVALGVRTAPADEAVGQEAPDLRIEPLARGALFEQAIGVHAAHKVLRHFGVDREALGPRGARIDVDADLERSLSDVADRIAERYA